MTILDARQARPLDGGPSFSLANRLRRLAFALTWLILCRWSPPQLRKWRVAVLRLFGARLATDAIIYPSVRIWLPANLVMEQGTTLGPGVECYNMAPITLGAGAIVSQRAFLCAGTHDYRDPAMQLLARPIIIGPKAWVAAEAFVGPGVTIGEGAVLGARAAATRDLDSWTVYAGNPCTPLGPRVMREPAAG